MEKRASELLNRKRGATTRGTKSLKDAPAGPEISTFHSLCVRILRRNIERLGYPQRFLICDRNEQESQARTALRELRAPNAALSPGDMLAIVSRWKSASVRPAEAVQIAQTEREQLAAAAYRRYQDNLKRVGTVDFDDLLLLTEELLSNFPAVCRAESRASITCSSTNIRIPTAANTRLSNRSRRHRNLCVVGDDDQSIYGCARGSDAHPSIC